MHYSGVRRGVFVDRPNRFIAHAELDGQRVVCHVKNTGRCRELLTPGAVIYLQESDNPNRKTRYDLIAVEKGGLLINMDAQAPNQVFREWAEGGGFLPGLSLLRPETTWGNSRFDFYWELSTGRRGFVEVKGVTLEENGYARWYHVGSAAGKTMSVHTTGTGGFWVYDAQGQVVASSVLWDDTSVTLPSGGLVVFAGDPGARFHLSFRT